MNSISLGLARPQTGPWWPAGARYAADFVNGCYMRDGTSIAEASALTLTRASGKWAPDQDGVWHYFGPNVLARTNAGALIEPAGTNLVPNPGLSGAAVGIVGAGGSLPTGWYTNNVLATEVLAITSFMGLPALRIRASGAANGVFYELGLGPVSTAIAASTAYCSSIFLMTETGPMPEVQLRQATATDAVISVGLLEPLSAGRLMFKFTSHSTTGRGRLRATYTMAIGQQMAVEMLIACPQIEVGDSPTSPLVSPRDSDAVTALLPSYPQSFKTDYEGAPSSIAPASGGGYSLPLNSPYATIRSVSTLAA